MSTEIQATYLGGIIGIVGAVIGAAAGGLVSYWLESLRVNREKLHSSTRDALDWAAQGRMVSLRRAVLSKADLRAVDLGPGAGRDLGADLSYSNLKRADLSEANLTQADLRWANLAYALLVDSKLHAARLERSDMRRADLRGADLSGAILAYANLQRADFRGADLEGANLCGADLRGALVDERELNAAQTREGMKGP